MTRVVTAAELNRCVLGRQFLAARSSAALTDVLEGMIALGTLFDDTRSCEQ